MPEQEGATPRPPSPPNPADSGPATPRQNVAISQHQAQATDPPRAERPADPAQTVTKEVADKLREAAVTLTATDRALAQQASELAGQASDPVRSNQRSFQHELAYAVQDVEKAGGGPIGLSDQARAEVTRLAGTAPSLENERMQALMRLTGAIAERTLVQEIRRAGSDIGQQADQNAPAIRDRLDTLENKVRLATRVETPVDPVQATQTARQPSEAPAPRQTPTERRETGGSEAARSAASTLRQNMDRPIVVETGFTGALMDGVLRAMRPPGSENTPPWEAGAQPFGRRLAAFEEKTRDDQTLRGAERAGRAALDAMESFRDGEGAAVLNRIREAAKTDPGGMAGVLAEMREGGKFADLRQQFNTALSDERGATAAYDKAASALARYGEDRKTVDQIIARRPDATNLSAKFETMDKEIGSAAREIPSRRDGKTMLDDLGKQVAEMLRGAVDSVRNLFRGSSAGASPGASPS